MSSLFHYRARIERHIDADSGKLTIDLGFSTMLSNKTWRLYGCDTPESRTRDPIEKAFGLASKEYVARLMPKGSWQTIQTFKDEREKYGRVLCDFIIYDPRQDRERSLVEMLIEDKMAVAYHGQSKDDIKQAHLDNRKYLLEHGVVSVSPDYR